MQKQPFCKMNMTKMKNMTKIALVTFPVILCLLLAGTATHLAAAEQPANYVVIFQATEYNSKLGDAVSYFFKDILKPEDNLSFFTPARPYAFSRQTRAKTPLPKLIKRTNDVLKRDISVGAANYNSILEQMIQVIRNLAEAMGTSRGGGMGGMSSTADLKNQMVNYRTLKLNLKNLRKLNEKLFMDFARMFKNYKGKNHIYVFYQKEERVIPDRDTMEALRNNQEVRFDAVELFQEDSTDEFMNVEKVKAALQESSATLHFIYMNKKSRRRQGMEIKEFSGDIYNVFSKLAEATGGLVMTTTKPAAALKKIGK